VAFRRRDLVLELDCLVQGFCFFPIGMFFVSLFSCSNWLCVETRWALMAMAQIKPSSSRADCGHDLPVILACHPRLHVALVQAILRFPCDCGDLCRNPLL